MEHDLDVHPGVQIEVELKSATVETEEAHHCLTIPRLASAYTAELKLTSRRFPLLQVSSSRAGLAHDIWAWSASPRTLVSSPLRLGVSSEVLRVAHHGCLESAKSSK